MGAVGLRLIAKIMEMKSRTETLRDIAKLLGL